MLHTISVEGYKCYRSKITVPLRRLTVFIGENDAGKTTILNCIRLLLNDTQISLKQSDFTNEENNTISFIGEFLIREGNYTTLEEKGLLIDGMLTIKKTYTGVNQFGYEVFSDCYVDARFNNLDSLSHLELGNIISEFGLESPRKKEDRVFLIKTYVEEKMFEKHFSFRTITYGEIVDFLPKVRYISSSDYQDPSHMTRDAFQDLARRFIKTLDDNNNIELNTSLKSIKDKIQEILIEKQKEIMLYLSKNLGKIKEISVPPKIDFSRGITIDSMSIDCGDGLRDISSYGEGTKKKIWMGLLDWMYSAEKEFEDLNIIRIFDEPDINLDYSAEKSLIRLISSTIEQSGIQNIISTHSVTMIDHVSPLSIVLITVGEKEERLLEWIDAGIDPDEMYAFYNYVGNELGMRNTSFFYEKCFLVFEGPTEENALPIMYRNMFGNTLYEDGIVPVNLEGCGNVELALKILGSRKRNKIVLLLDKDCLTQPDDKKRHITLEKLKKIGYDEDFLSKNCIFIGEKELEDAFSDTFYVDLLNKYSPRDDGEDWKEQHILSIRDSEKFSNDIVTNISIASKPKGGMTKPQLGTLIGRYINHPQMLPDELEKVLRLAREIAGLYD